MNSKARLHPYAVATISVLLIAACEEAVHAPIDDKSRFLVLEIPVAIAAWLGGRGPGLVGLSLSCLVGAFLYLPPKYSFLVESPADVVSLVLYAVVSLILIEIIESQRRSRQSLARSEAEVKKLNEDLMHSLAEKEWALVRQRQFTSDASHELKTPLTTIRARSGIALSGPAEPEELVDHIVAMNRASEVMIAVVQDLLLLAASDEGQLQLRRELSPARLLVEDALASVDIGSRAIDVSIDPGLMIDCDPDAITRVLVNLLQNAIVHTPVGQAICVICFTSDEAVSFIVIDEGSGIPAEHLERIFDRFHRVDGARDRESGGSGLGLAIVRAIVEAHGGSVSIESTVGTGTKVTVTLPN